MLEDKFKALSIKMWGTEVAAVSWEKQGFAVFEYTDAIRHTSLDISPLVMPVNSPDQIQFSNKVIASPFTFPELDSESFHGLPGLLADTLPGECATTMFNEYAAREGRSQQQLAPLQSLYTVGARGMGALEFESRTESSGSENLNTVVPVKIEDLFMTLKSVIHDRGQMQLSLSDEDDQASEKAFYNLMRVSTSAGGSQAKAVIAINEKTGEILSGQSEAPVGYDHWLLKFDEVSDSQFASSKQTTRIEFAYALMARAAKINISECRLLEENDRAHFITRRFDRISGQNEGANHSTKLHMQSLFSLAHYDYSKYGKYSYEQAFEIMRQLHLPKSDSLELYRRMLFNVFARNQNDNTKNIAFLMNQSGKWSLAPAYNLTYSYNPDWGRDQHQMSVNGKCDNFTRQDLLTVGEALSLPKVERIIDEVKQAVSQWPTFARRAGVKKKMINDIAKMQRLVI